MHEQQALPINSPEAIAQALAGKTIAVVGLSSDPQSPSYGVAAYLQGQGYHIIPVNPKEQEVLGERAYPSLRDVPQPVDVVDIFRRAEAVPGIVEDAIAIGAPTVWMQLGIVNEAAAQRAHDAGLNVVMDHCMRVEHRARPAARS
jgi:predicted CoA-binding protein